MTHLLLFFILKVMFEKKKVFFIEYSDKKAVVVFTPCSAINAYYFCWGGNVTKIWGMGSRGK